MTDIPFEKAQGGATRIKVKKEDADEKGLVHKLKREAADNDEDGFEAGAARNKRTRVD